MKKIFKKLKFKFSLVLLASVCEPISVGVLLTIAAIGAAASGAGSYFAGASADASSRRAE